MGEASVSPAYRRDFANIGLDGYAWQLWGAASFSMAAWVVGAGDVRPSSPSERRSSRCPL